MSDIIGLFILNKNADYIKPITINNFDSIEWNTSYFQFTTPKKFIQDQFLFHNDKFIIGLRGIILNKSQIQDKNKEPEFSLALIKEFELKGSSFFKELRGSFSGVLVDKRKNTAFIFTNHFGDKQIFFSKNEGFLIFSNKVSYIIDFYKQNRLSYSIDEEGIGSMLSYGFMLEDYTLIKEIKKLSYGSLIEIKDNTANLIRYWDFDNSKYTKDNEKEILFNVNHLFREAVKSEYEKDVEYGYKHFSTLSAGLDSRMSVFVANELGFAPQINFTYSRGDYEDQKVAQKIANDLGNSFLFYLLNENNFFENYEELININSGRCSVAGSISGYNATKHIDFSQFGIVHTGQLGDVILGTYNRSPNHVPMLEYSGAFSTIKLSFAPKIDKNKYKNNEHFMLSQRGLNGILQGNLFYMENSEVCSPFLDVDFFEYCMSIPLEFRFNHRIYIKWIRQFYPKAAKYKWDKILAPLSMPIFQYKSFLIPISTLWNIKSALLPRMGKSFRLFDTFARKNSMTPLQYWFENNPLLQKKMKEAIYEGFETSKLSKEVRDEMVKIQNGSNFLEKSQLLTVIDFIKKYL